MVDSNDRDRVVEARDELHRMLNEVINPNMTLLGACVGSAAFCLNKEL